MGRADLFPMPLRATVFGNYWEIDGDSRLFVAV